MGLPMYDANELQADPHKVQRWKNLGRRMRIEGIARRRAIVISGSLITGSGHVLI